MGRIVINETENKQTVILNDSPEGVEGGYFDEEMEWHEIGAGIPDSQQLYLKNVNGGDWTWEIGTFKFSPTNALIKAILRVRSSDQQNNTYCFAVGNHSKLSQLDTPDVIVVRIDPTSTPRKILICTNSQVYTLTFESLEEPFTVEFKDGAVFVNNEKVVDYPDEFKLLTEFSIGQINASVHKFRGYYDLLEVIKV